MNNRPCAARLELIESVTGGHPRGPRISLIRSVALSQRGVPLNQLSLCCAMLYGLEIRKLAACLRRGDMAPTDTASYLAEAHGTYAAGLLALALSAEHIADDAVRSGIVTPLARYLRRSCGCATAPEDSATVPELLLAELASGEQLSTCRRGSRRHRPECAGSCDGSAVAALPLIRATSGATVLWADMGDGGVATVTEASDNSMRHGAAEFCEAAEELRSRREVYALQGVGCLGEYLECVAPLMQARSARTLSLLQTHDWLCRGLASPQVNRDMTGRCRPVSACSNS